MVIECVMQDASDMLPDLNTFLLIDFRRESIEKIPDRLGELFSALVKMFKVDIKHIGYEELTPDERIKFIATNKNINNSYPVLKSTLRLLRYNFQKNGIVEGMIIHVPYMEDYAIWSNGVDRTPLLPIIERGGLNVVPNGIILRVLRQPIHFRRELYVPFETVDGIKFREIVVTVKIHHRNAGKNRNDKMPLIIYDLCLCGFDKAMEKYGFTKGEIWLSNHSINNADETSIELGEGMYLAVKRASLNESETIINFKRRVIASYVAIIKELPPYEFRDLFGTGYYKAALGRYTLPLSKTNRTVLFEDAVDHLNSTIHLLDPPSKHQLATIGVEVEDICDLLRFMFFNIDVRISRYNPIDLSGKKIGALDLTLAPIVSGIHTKLFKSINSNKNRKNDMDDIAFRSFIKKSTQYEGICHKSPIYQSAIPRINDNPIITVLCKKFRALDNIESVTNKVQKKRTVPVSALLAHPSCVMVESIHVVTSSSPCNAGDINPMVEIDGDGNFLLNEEDYALIANVYN